MDIAFVMRPHRVADKVFEVIAARFANDRRHLDIGSLGAKWSYEDGIAAVAIQQDTVITKDGRMSGSPVGYARLTYIIAGGNTGIWTEITDTWTSEEAMEILVGRPLCRMLLKRSPPKINTLLSRRQFDVLFDEAERYMWNAVPIAILPAEVRRFSRTCATTQDGLVYIHHETRERFDLTRAA